MKTHTNWIFREGKRKCYICKEVKDLTHFYKRKGTKYKGARAYRYGCIECNKILNQKYRFRTRFVEKAGNKCKICGLYNKETAFFDVDHINSSLKISKNRSGKASEKDNLQVLCPNCHRIKSIENDEIGRRAGLKTYGKISRFKIN